MRVYKFESGTLPIPAREAEPGPYRLRKPQDAVWPPAGRAYGGPEETFWERVTRHLKVGLRLVLPVLLLVTLLGAVYLFCDAPLPAALVPGLMRFAALSWSDFALPAAWTVIHLTNRRYGPSYAFAQLVTGLVLAVLAALINPADIDAWIPALPALTARAIAAFMAAFLVANFVAIVFFDAMRGPRWWTAPLAASAAASFVFSALYFPAAFAGAVPWAPDALVHVLLFFGESVLLLLPYRLLRAAMRPLPGLNGY